MKFVHIADMHFDTPFTLLSDRANLGELRRLDQRLAFKKMIDYIKENQIPYLFIAGDFYDHEYIKESTIEYINDCFKDIPDTKIFITPGNHDPYLKNSYYSKYNWNDNVKIFTSKVEKVELPDCDIYGFGFEDFYMNESQINRIHIDNPNKINILITHGNLDSGNDEQRSYNPMTTAELKQLGFDYIALGHIHKRNLTTENSRIIYPGSTISLGFDELGEHGMVVGDINKIIKDVNFVKLDDREYKEVEVDVSEFSVVEDLLEHIINLNLNVNDLYKIILVGNRRFDINTYKLIKMIEIRSIIKIKDQTTIGYNLKAMSNDTSLKGLFAKEMLNKLEDENIDKELVEKAIEIGLDALS